ncbi:MAG TPA: hypothetical protein VIJ51_18995 [Solirubrobacteraceae bacterium]
MVCAIYNYGTQTDHGHRLHEYLTSAITADLHGQPIPALLAPT